MKFHFFRFLIILIYSSLSFLIFFNISLLSIMENDSAAYVGYLNCFERCGAFNTIGDHICHNWYSLGYPAFMVCIRSLLGKSFWPVIFIQIFLAILIIFLIFKIASYFFSRKVANLSMILASFSLGILLYPYFILTESLLCFLLLFGFERFVSYLFSGKLSSLILSALLFGLSIVVKSAAIFFVPFLAIILLFVKQGFSKKIINAAIFLFFFLLPVFGYVLRNQQVYGYFYLKSVDKVNLYGFYLPEVYAESENIPFDDANKYVRSLIHVDNFASGEGYKEVHELFCKTIIKHPFLAVKIWMKNVMKTFLGLYTNHLKVLLYPEIKDNNGYCSFFSLQGSFIQKVWKYLSFHTNSKFLVLLSIFEVIWNVLRYLFVLIALSFLFLKRKFLLFVLFSSYIFYFSIISGHAGCARFRFLFEPILIILTAVGIFILYNFVFGKKEEIFLK
ncbi:TPA: hypothetical protein DEO28_00655 [Candidatus Dependentiae bacterium]|nr:MAG: Dolichyl-phosphate-mannose-protein mannosyltransferase family protein [candidate division TM6 bacterium GW2011_GWE2_31_21]KKP54102.1 MAG: Dolichyl-phosphate-mannose-protein mannosyltransferase family protein [candidate division TM6 bacterium GW2011_GWF2_33_332]HBS48316.1 hypothetical protein [Candidatus Dependentiae bacterium]HBZ73010.1 hypothetical protein [Candidatus Dependentiae bacterium]